MRSEKCMNIMVLRAYRVRSIQVHVSHVWASDGMPQAGLSAGRGRAIKRQRLRRRPNMILAINGGGMHTAWAPEGFGEVDRSAISPVPAGGCVCWMSAAGRPPPRGSAYVNIRYGDTMSAAVVACGYRQRLLVRILLLVSIAKYSAVSSLVILKVVATPRQTPPEESSIIRVLRACLGAGTSM